MPLTAVVFYQETDGSVPVLNWLDELRTTDRKGWANCVARIHRLAEAGHELRRPEAERALFRKRAFERSPADHTYNEPEVP